MALYPEDIDFKVLNEKWNVYDLGDGITIKTKLVLGKILAPPGVPLEYSKEFRFQAKPLISIYAPTSKKGEPYTLPLTSDVIEESIIEDIDPKPIEEYTNEYELKHGIIVRLKLMLTRVSLTDKFSADGSPVFAIGTQVVPHVIYPKGFHKKFKRKKPSSKTTRMRVV